MPAHIANLINALLLIAVSAWAYFTSATPSLTALIPAGFGLVLLACSPGVKSEHKVISHIAVVLTLVVLVALIMPLKGAIIREDTMAMIRVGVMMLGALLAMVFFVKSFIDVRRNRRTP